MAESTLTANPPDYPRRWSRMHAITLSDTVTDRNLQRNRVPYKWLHNVGTSGKVFVTFDDDNSASTKAPIWIPQGGFVEGGQWANALATDATAGIELYGLVGYDDMD